MKQFYPVFFISSLFLIFSCNQNRSTENYSLNSSISKKVDSVLLLMTLEEKVGQMNQYNGFWDVTGPSPKDGDAAKKYDVVATFPSGIEARIEGVTTGQTLEIIEPSLSQPNMLSQAIK